MFRCTPQFLGIFEKSIYVDRPHNQHMSPLIVASGDGPHKYINLRNKRLGHLRVAQVYYISHLWGRCLQIFKTLEYRVFRGRWQINRFRKTTKRVRLKIVCIYKGTIVYFLTSAESVTFSYAIADGRTPLRFVRPAIA